MNSSLPTSPMLSEAHLILDSKIKHIEKQALCNLQDCVYESSAASSPTQDKATILTKNFERMLQQIQSRTSELKQLQIIRCWLREENLNKVMILLHKDSYLQYTEESLEKLLKQNAVELMRMKYMA